MEPTKEQREGQARYLLRINLEQYLFHGTDPKHYEQLLVSCRDKYGDNIVLDVICALTREYREQVPQKRLVDLWTW